MISLHVFFSQPRPRIKHTHTQWEDPACEHGGKWTVLVPRGQNSKATLDTMWLNTLLAAIGEQFAEGDEVCVWTRTASDEAAQVSIAKQLKALLDLDSSARVGFLSHADAKSMGRQVKERYIV